MQSKETRVPSVSETAKQGADPDDPSTWSWVEASIWTERMFILYLPKALHPCNSGWRPWATGSKVASGSSCTSQKHYIHVIPVQFDGQSVCAAYPGGGLETGSGQSGCGGGRWGERGAFQGSRGSLPGGTAGGVEGRPLPARAGQAGAHSQGVGRDPATGDTDGQGPHRANGPEDGAGADIRAGVSPGELRFSSGAWMQGCITGSRCATQGGIHLRSRCRRQELL